MSIVQLGDPGRKQGDRKRPSLGLPIVHKFFLAGGMAGFLGTTWLGVHLWLMLNGIMPISKDFHGYRQVHATIQFYGFLGLFIAGFLLQAAPKLFQLKPGPPRLATFALTPTLLGLVILAFSPLNRLPDLCFGATWIVVTLFVVRLLGAADRIDIIRVGIPIFMGCCAFVYGVTLDHTLAADALLLFWCGVIPIIFATAQQFILAFVGGHRLEGKHAPIFLALLIVSVVTLLAHRIAESDALWSLFALSSAIAFLYFGFATRVAVSCWRRLYDPVAFAFAATLLWGVAGSLSLLRGPAAADFTLHIWATGIAVTLIMATSSRIVGFLAGQTMTDRHFVLVLAAWQLVPLGRGRLFPLPAWFSWVVGIAAMVSLTVWLALIIYRTIVLVRRSLAERAMTERPVAQRLS